MNWAEIRKSFFYWVALISAGLLTLALLFCLASRRFLGPQTLYFDDFTEYWAAGRLNLTQNNPYRSAQMLG